jgi:hypothetical protein
MDLKKRRGIALDERDVVCRIKREISILLSFFLSNLRTHVALMAFRASHVIFHTCFFLA